MSPFVQTRDTVRQHVLAIKFYHVSRSRAVCRAASGCVAAAGKYDVETANALKRK
jgi:hypothetical protein